jgi:hypothetical protein
VPRDSEESKLLFCRLVCHHGAATTTNTEARSARRRCTALYCVAKHTRATPSQGPFEAARCCTAYTCGASQGESHLGLGWRSQLGVE